MLAPDFPPPAFPDALIYADIPAAPPPRNARGAGHADFLNLPDLESDPEIEEGKSLIYVKAEQVSVPTYPDCACEVKEVKAHTPFTMKRVLHVPQGRKSVVIDIKRRRWMCKEKSCRKTVTQPLDFMAEGHYKMTRRLLEYLEVQSLLGTELSLAEETGVYVRTIREIRLKFVGRLEKEVKFDTPFVLGLDGVRADRRRRRVIFTDIEAGLVLDLIGSGSKVSVADRIRKFLGWEKIGIFTIDMDRTLLAAILDARPGAKIVVDRFHIVRIANKVMDKVRNDLFPRDKAKREPGQPFRPRPEPFRKRRATLTKKDLEHMEYWYNKEIELRKGFKQHKESELRLAYDLKEAFMEIFDEETYGGRKFMSKSAARHFYENWLNRLPATEELKPLLDSFRKIRSAMDNFGEYILNYFDCRYTNAFTESKNRKIKDILRDARGCDLKTVHARIVYGTYLMKQLRTVREAEREAVMPHSKRKNWRPPSAKGKGAPKGKEAESGPGNGYKLPDLRQMALDFTIEPHDT
jgi:transposase